MASTLAITWFKLAAGLVPSFSISATLRAEPSSDRMTPAPSVEDVPNCFWWSNHADESL